MRKIMNNQTKTGDVRESILSAFQVNNSYSNSEIKKILGQIYEKLSYQRTPKATDLNEIFKVKACKVTNSETKKRENGLLIISLKE